MAKLNVSESIRSESIREVARETGLSAHTLRYYERIGLLGPIERGPNGARRFARQDLEWIAFLNRLRSTGMPVSQMLRFADLRRGGESTLSERRSLLENHDREIARKIRELKDNAEVIQEKIALYRAMEEKPNASDERGPPESRGPSE